MDAANAHALYDQKYQELWSRTERVRNEMYLQEIRRIFTVTNKHSGRILDMGCGPGNFLDEFPSESWQKYGIEVSKPFLIECEKKGIRTNIPLEKESFDLVVMRGTIQHFDRPMEMIFKAYECLKPGGWLCFLATPNTGGIVYRLFQDLPMISPKFNFVLFSDRILRQCLVNVGFKEDLKFFYPYLGTPYAQPLRDHLKFVARFFGFRAKFAFWGNMFECFAQK